MPTFNEQIVALRQKTGAGMMDCKSALSEAGGDFEKAIEALRKKGLADAARRSGRSAKEGVVAACVLPDASAGALIEINCQTDFVARGEDFQALACGLARRAAEGSLASPEAAGTEAALVGAKVGENVVLRRLARFVLSGPGLVCHYVHTAGSKKGALLELGAATPEAARHEAAAQLGRELCLQVTAMAPRWLKGSEVPPGVLDKEREIFSTQARNEGKPEDKLAKIVEGRLQKLFIQTACLLDMVSMRDNKTPVSRLLAEASARAGGPLEVRRFVRYQVGED